MLKKITVLIIFLVLLKPTYDFSSKFFDDANQFLNENSIDIKNAKDVITDMTNTAEDAIANTTTTISTLKNTDSKLPNTVQSVNDLADAFYYYFSRWETNFEINYVGSTTDIENIIDKAVKDASSRDQYIEGHLAERRIEYEYSLMDAKISVHQQYLTNAAQEEFVNEQVANIIASVSPESMTDFEKVKFVNDYIVKNTVYSTNTTSSPHSACTVLKENKGVCQGYALLALKMLQALGVETKYVVGEVKTGGHAWNLVKIDGQWYHLDTTWNDPLPDRGKGVRYEYFLINDAQMKLDHSWNQSDYPAATSNKYVNM